MQQLTTKQPATPRSLAAGRGSGQNSTSSNAARNNSITFRNQQGQVVGRLEGGWLAKHVNTRQHQLRVPPAWAADVEHIEQLRRLGAKGVRLTDEKGRIWTAPLSRWQGLKTLDRGHGLQYILPLAKWDIEDPAGPRQLRLLEVLR